MRAAFHGSSWFAVRNVKSATSPAKFEAFNAGLERVRSLRFDVIGNLDADLSFEPDYLEFLVKKFAEDPKLGVAGTPFIENGYDSARDSFEGQNHVPGGCQLFRRKCYEEIGGYVANRAGGVDWMAVTTARMKGWKTRSFSRKTFSPLPSIRDRPTKSNQGHISPMAKRTIILATLRSGNCAGSATGWPSRHMSLREMALMSGFCWAALRRTQRPISRELMRFHRAEQMIKLKMIFGSLIQFKNPDNFRLETRTKLP